MQHSPHEIKEKLLKALDKDYNVLDMPVVLEIVGILEQTAITKEALESTRLGKYINELRRKTNNELLAKRTKDLVRKWRDLILPQTNNSNGGDNGSSRQSTNRIISPVNKTLSTWNDGRQISPGLTTVKSTPSSPSSRLSSLSPGKQRSSRPPSPTSKQSSLPIRTTSSILKKLEVQSVDPPANTTSANSSPEQAPTPVPPPVHRGRGRPPLDRTKTPPRPRGRPPSSDQPPRGRGRPPLDPEKRAARGRGRGRPPKNKNKLKKQEAIANNDDELVPKTSPANKRLRKTSEDEDSQCVKKQKLNGVYDTIVPDEINQVPTNDSEQEPVRTPKKRGRKKGSKNAPKISQIDRDFEDDVIKKKLANRNSNRNPKVKTTMELLECIQKESSLDNLRSKTLTSIGVGGEKCLDSEEEEMNKSKTEHIHKFLRSQMDNIDYEPVTDNNHYQKDTKYNSKISVHDSNSPLHETIRSPPEVEEIIDVEKLENAESRDSKNNSNNIDKVETISDILARLPPINASEIVWTDDEYNDEDSVCDERVISEGDIDKLQNEHIECVNGNWNDGDLVPGLNHGLNSLLPPHESEATTTVHDDNFREWQECVSKTTYSGNLLHILPYVIID